MCQIILPIKGKYTRDILSGAKTFEIRRSIPKRKVDGILIYETAPVSKIVGEIKVSKTHHLPVEKLWRLTKNSNSLTKKEFLDYFKGKEKGYAYEVAAKKEFKIKKTLGQYKVKAAPQGFVYVK